MMTSIYHQPQQYSPRNGPTRRSFSPTRNRRYGKPTFPIKKLVRYSPKYGYSRLFNFPFPGSNWRPRMNTIVIQTHGIACPNSGMKADSVAAAGVFFGANCPHNINFVLPNYMDQTNNKAVLEAIRTALNEVMTLRHTVLDPRWKEVIIMTNSEYAKKSLNQWAWSWEQNGWNHMRQQNKPIAHLDTMQDLHNIITHIETTLNMVIRLWKVDREDIAGADGLAHLALQMTSKQVNGVADAHAMMAV